MMNRDTFEDVMKDAADEFGWWFMPMDDSWELWSEIVSKPQEYPQEVVEAILSMDTQERLIWRTELSEKGYEMTPMQVDQYIYIIQIAREDGVL
tara:strand:+ start:113 stop:394 length:282 start_codon:yes stop_codon:yes gene_type:complete